MVSRTDGLALQDLLLTEAVKDLEVDTPLRDDAALAAAVAESSDRQARIVHRARRLAADTGLAEDLARLRDRMVTLGLALAALGVVLAGLVALALLGEGRRINAVAAITLLIAPNLLGIVVWAVLAVAGARGGSGAFGRAVAALARHRRAPEHVRRVWPAAACVLDAQRLTVWALGGLNHLLWALVYAAAALMLVAVFALSEYRLGWETTILAPQTLHDVARGIAWLPEQLGLPAQVPENLDDPGASRLLGRWLIAGTLAYGTLPRALLALLCGAVLLARRRRGLPLDLDDPYHRRLIARFEALAPTRVLDAEHAAAASAHRGAVADAEPGSLALIGFELPDELALPPPLLERALWSERLDGGAQDRQAVLCRLAEQPPAWLVLACHAPSTPDRGTRRFIEAARAGRIALLLLPQAEPQHAARWRDWLAEAGLSGVLVLDSADEALPIHG
jgi:hypothetical protein